MKPNKAFHPYGAQGAPRVNADVVGFGENMHWLLVLLLTITLAHTAGAAPLFEIDFENPPHNGTVAVGNNTNWPSDRPSVMTGHSYSVMPIVTNVAAMTGQAALLDSSHDGYPAIVLSTSTNDPRRNLVASSSGVNRLEWKMTVLDWSWRSWPNAEICSETSEGTDDPISIYFHYNGEATGIIQFKSNVIGSFTTNQTYHFKTETDLDEDTVNVWLDEVQVVTNQPIAPESTMWYVILTAGPAVGAKVAYDDIIWKQIERPEITQALGQTVEWRCESNYSYRVQSAPAIRGGDWTNVTDSMLATSSTMTAVLPMSDVHTRIIRVKAEE